MLNTEDKALLKKFLARVPVFRCLSDRHVDYIVSGFSIRSARKGETVFFQADESTELYIILRGRVKVTLLSEGGEEFILTDLNEGDFFGELSLIDGNPRSATVIAEDDSTFAVLQRERLLNTIRQEPDIAIELLVSVVQRLRRATEREETLAFYAVRERIVRYFIQVIKSENSREDSKGYYRIGRRTHRDIAERIGASRASITKLMKTLLANGLVVERPDALLIASRLIEEVEEDSFPV